LKVLDRFMGMFRKQVQYLGSFEYGRPHWTTQRDEQYIKEAYNKIVWVYACVSMIASSVSSVPWLLYRQKGKESIEIDDHPILNMLNNSANPYFSSKDFFDAWATYLALQGRFYVEFNNPILPTQMYWLFPHMTRPIPDKKLFVSGYEYDINGDKKIYRADEIMCCKFLDPLDAYAGLSPIRAMARTIDSENKAVDWNKSTLDNAGIPPGALKVINPGPDLSENLRNDWLKRYAGAKNARVPLIIDSEKADWVQFGIDPIDMDFLNQRKLNRVEICAAFGVPSQVVGDPEGQKYSNYEEAVKAFWKQTVIPKYLDKIKGTLQRDLVNRYADNLVLQYNLDNITVLQESLDGIAKRVGELFKNNIITKNEAREAVGYDKVADGEIFYNDLSIRLASAKPVQQNNNDNSSLENPKKKALKESEDDQSQIWEQFDKHRLPFEAKLEEGCKSYFELERKQIQKVLSKTKNINEAEKTMIKVVDSNKLLKKLLVATYMDTMQAFGSVRYNDFKKQYNKKNEKSQVKADDYYFDVYNQEIIKFIDETVAEKVVNITDTSKNAIKDYVGRAVEMGWGIPQLSDAIDRLYLDQIIPNRSTVIARTETVGASNAGDFYSAEQAMGDFDFELYKKWLNTRDGRTRDTHVSMSSHPAIPMDEKFKVGRGRMKFPGDPSGPAEEVIQCRCTLIYVDAPGEGEENV
jgi:HK97 family phage portal protein